VSTVDAGPEAVWALVDGHATYWAAAAAAEAGLLDEAAGGVTAGTLAATVGAPAHRLAPLLDVLADAGILRREGDRFSTTAAGDAARRMAGLLAGSPGRHENWLGLAGVLQGGEPPAPVDDDGRFRAALALATRDVQLELARRLAARLPAPRSVDAMGPSAAAWLEGLSAPSTEPPHDLVVLAHACRERSPVDAAAIVRAAADRAAPGGRVVVADYFTDAEDAGRARRAHVLGLTMVANTRHGCAHAAADITGWLLAAGLVDVELLDGRPAPHDLLVARKPLEHEGSTHADG
jgi:hypothetical protein